MSETDYVLRFQKDYTISTGCAYYVAAFRRDEDEDFGYAMCRVGVDYPTRLERFFGATMDKRVARAKQECHRRMQRKARQQRFEEQMREKYND